MPLKAFSFFHLNLAYSAISEERRPEVVDRCYWPLLRLAKKFNLPFGIEASAWTLETIQAIDPHWIQELKDLVTHGPCEFIGCGYAQIIGPLVPAEVNQANLRLGMKVYEQLLGLTPKVALVNEQAYSAGLVPLYKEAGYEAIIMEWNNPAKAHPDWRPEWRYLPHYACGTLNSEIPVIWNKSVAFQKVQRYVHGEIELDEYLTYLRSHQVESPRAFPIYGNDVEVFDFRPGRYMTEAPLHDTGEWARMEEMYASLLKEANIEMIRPSEVLSLLSFPEAGNRLHLETASYPIPVKKQDKYNVLRWAVTGRDDFAVNTRCWRIFENLRLSPNATELDWAELCYLWSSDFRTHITHERWVTYLERLKLAEQKWELRDERQVPQVSTGREEQSSTRFTISRNGRLLEIKGQRLRVQFNCLKGMAIESFIDQSISEKVLFGTLPHGSFDHIGWSADFYSGHLTYESPGRPKVTDLLKVEPIITFEGETAVVSAEMQTPLGPIAKNWRIDDKTGELKQETLLDWQGASLGALRYGYLTLLPESFNASALYFATHNGGHEPERFDLAGREFDHGTQVSFLISASQAVGLTKGGITTGDQHTRLKLRVDKSSAAAVALVSHREIGGRYLSRVALTVREMDDTSRPHSGGIRATLTVTYSAFRDATADISSPLQ